MVAVIANDTYKSISKPSQGLFKDNGSRFIALAYPVESEEQVKEIVAMGRNPHKRLFQADTDADRRIVRESLERIGMAELADRNYQHLSGGEKQRVLIARMLEQQTEFLILDEPTNHLDVRYQLQIFDLVKSLPVTVLAAVHDMNMAAAYCDYLYAIRDGRVALAGTAEHIREVFDVEADVSVHPRTGRLNVVFLSGRTGKI